MSKPYTKKRFGSDIFTFMAGIFLGAVFVAGSVACPSILVTSIFVMIGLVLIGFSLAGISMANGKRTTAVIISELQDIEDNQTALLYDIIFEMNHHNQEPKQ